MEKLRGVGGGHETIGRKRRGRSGGKGRKGRKGREKEGGKRKDMKRVLLVCRRRGENFGERKGRKSVDGM